jgi:hypothetical protein
MHGSDESQGRLQHAIIGEDESDPIPFSPVLFASRSRRYHEGFMAGWGPTDIRVDCGYQ